MKRTISLVFLWAILLLAGAQTAWMDTYEEAQKKCSDENKLLLLVFSGSDWCKPCIRLKTEILDTPEFQLAVAGKWVLYNADFPYKTKLDKALVKSNEALAEKYNNEGKFPKVLLLDQTGKVLAETGYKNVSAKEYIALLENQVK